MFTSGLATVIFLIVNILVSMKSPNIHVDCIISEGREGKKKKFRPFEAVRKFFKGGKKGNKSESRSQSRSLQMINAEDSDDDGGFVFNYYFFLKLMLSLYVCTKLKYSHINVVVRMII